MAWQLHYTSAECGPGGRAGFQFTAESAGVPPEVTGAVASHLAYRPPPEAPLAPDPAQIAALPVALAYGDAGDLRVLTRCVYLGQDYSGRYGNFLGHAVVATQDELTGLRPVELWQAPLWHDEPAPPGATLPELADLTPGDRLDPDSLGEWLATGGEQGYALLAVLLQIVGTALSRGHGRLVLVAAGTPTDSGNPTGPRKPSGPGISADPWAAIPGNSPDQRTSADPRFSADSGDARNNDPTDPRNSLDHWTPTGPRNRSVPSVPGDPRDSGRAEDVVRWIGVISYSLPWQVAAKLTFLTYSADPATASYVIVGTTPDVWIPSDTDATVVHLGAPHVPAVPVPGRFARTVAECWRRMDMAGIDAIGELVPAGGFSPDTAAALSAFCRGDGSVTEEEQAGIARTLRGGLPDWAWRELAGACDRMGFELATAARACAPAGLAGPFAARCAVLSLHDPALPSPEPPDDETRRALTPEAVRAVACADGVPSLTGVLRAVDHLGVPVPAAEVERAAHRAAHSGGDLADLLDHTPRALREAVVAGVLTGLEAASPRARRRLLTDRLCDHLESHDLTAAPRTCAAVVRLLALRARVTRVDATTRLLRLAATPIMSSDTLNTATPVMSGDPLSIATPVMSGDTLNTTTPVMSGDTVNAAEAPDVLQDVREVVERVLEEVWEAPPELGECAALVQRLGPGVSSSPCLSDLPARAYLAHGMAGPEVVRLAGAVQAHVPGYPAADAETVLLAAAAGDAADPPAAAALLMRLDDVAAEAHQDLVQEAVAVAVRSLAGRDPRFRAGLVTALPGSLRPLVARVWLEGRLSRDEQADLAETAVRLHHAGVTVPSLESFARSRLSSRSVANAVESRLRREDALAPSLRELSRGRRGALWKRENP
ncbi:hypothetical protein GCM10009677_55860 [Sphaerisporangium rubeum]|uniref:Uncharacterized protein n=1 Tax=Sphaerisporangium rubeum TaxID=321317 RepID=A0A7X0M7E5_9ACTN|nr:DUF963 domain-containing protein [Sphaerisporangium rubeum]MBB6474708.1 hypothetical protein [Sphaerisporangium rubeum]